MKKIICGMICLVVIFTILSNNVTVKSMNSKIENNTENNTDLLASIENKLIRFHVIANSDQAYDQALKLKVRDEVLRYITPKLKDCKDIEESRNLIKQNDIKIRELAQKIVKENGYTYSVNTMLSKENFPVKSYGNITLPQGEYEAYRIIIGSGSGQNWWCVMFPPLCFIDITKGEVSYKETEKSMKQVLTEKEYEQVDNTNITLKESSSSDRKVESGKIEIRFKILDEIRKLFK